MLDAPREEALSTQVSSGEGERGTFELGSRGGPGREARAAGRKLVDGMVDGTRKRQIQRYACVAGHGLTGGESSGIVSARLQMME